jgi:uncharacterized membrane protein
MPATLCAKASVRAGRILANGNEYLTVEGEMSMKVQQAVRVAVGVVTLALTIAGLSVSAHPMTYQGTVLAVEAARVQVRTVEDKKEETVWFVVNKDTKVKRGDKAVKYADAKIVKGERIVITIDHDSEIENLATDIRLAVAK